MNCGILPVTLRTVYLSLTYTKTDGILRGSSESFAKNLEARAGFCDCSEKVSKQIIAEVEDSCHTLTLSKCSLLTINPHHMLLFYSILFYMLWLIGVFCKRKTL